jgi:hypothetical protein
MDYFGVVPGIRDWLTSVGDRASNESRRAFGGGKRSSKMLLARVTGQLALLRYGAYWTILGSYPGFGIRAVGLFSS